MRWSLRALWSTVRRERPDNGRSVAEGRQGARDALRRAEGVSGEVAGAVNEARNAARRTDRFVREVERSLHQRGVS